MLKPECITMTIINKAGYNCTNLGIPPINMSFTEGNINIICETQPANLLNFQYSSFEIWHRGNKVGSCSMSVTLKENTEREMVCRWGYNLSTAETAIIYISRPKLTLAPPQSTLLLPRPPLKLLNLILKDF